MLIFVGVAHSGFCVMPLGYWAAIMAVFTAYIGIFGQAVGVQREFSGLMSKPWRMVTLHLGAWALMGQLIMGKEVSLKWGLTVLDWTLLIVIVGCFQTSAIRLIKIIPSLNAKS